jgi:hypothetical protein
VRTLSPVDCLGEALAFKALTYLEGVSTWDGDV